MYPFVWYFVLTITFNSTLPPPSTARNRKLSFNTAKLNHYRHLHHFHDALENKFSAENLLEWGSTEKWSQFKDTINSTAKAVRGPKTRSHQDWFVENDDSISAGLDAKKKVYYAEWQREPSSTPKKYKFKDLCSRVLTELMKMKDHGTWSASNYWRSQ